MRFCSALSLLTAHLLVVDFQVGHGAAILSRKSQCVFFMSLVPVGTVGVGTGICFAAAIRGPGRRLFMPVSIYDKNLFGVFFTQLGIPYRRHESRIGSGTYPRQTADIISGLERGSTEWKPNIVLVRGNVNSMVAAALVQLPSLWGLVRIRARKGSIQEVRPVCPIARHYPREAQSS